jgi:uncharacterized membrane protein YbhN (UPF0104 family)
MGEGTGAHAGAVGPDAQAAGERAIDGRRPAERGGLPRWATPARQVVAFTLGAGLLAFVAARADWASLGSALARVAAWRWLAAAAGLLASYLLRAGRIHAELGPRWRVPYRRCLGVVLVHNAALNVVPARGGELAYPWLLHRRLQVPVADAVGSLVWLRCQDALTLALLAAALWPGVPAQARWAGAAVVLAAMVGLSRALRALAARASRPGRSPSGLRAALLAAARAPDHRLAGWAFCLSSWGVKLAAVASLLTALTGLGLPAALSGALGGELAGALPLQGPAGFGTYEVGTWLGAGKGAGGGVQVAVAAGAVHVFSLATALVAGGLAAVAPRLLRERGRP